jgi:hypothetical protein
MAAFGTASAVPVYLVQDGYHGFSSGTNKKMFFDGSDTAAGNQGASTSTWDYTAGVLTMTSGTLRASAYTSNNGITGTIIWSDILTGLVIDTTAGTTTATSYDCIEGTFGPPTNHSCGNFGLGGNGVSDSAVTYNVGGAADCSTVVTGGDDAAVGAPGMRSLRERTVAGGGCDATQGAYDDINVFVDNLGTGGQLILANATGTGGSIAMPGSIPVNCIGQPAPGPIVPDTVSCKGAHWLTFVPVPAAAWLFGPALGLLGLARRRTA